MRNGIPRMSRRSPFIFPMTRPTYFQRLLDWLPGVRLLWHYDRGCLPHDLAAGLVVTLVLIPSAIAYADLAGLPPVAGLYAALGGMIAFALFTSSRHVIVGPDAALAIMVGAAVAPLADGDASKAVALSAWLALLAAAILLLAAWLRLGAAADFLSSPVMLGFLNGAAVVIMVSQLGRRPKAAKWVCGISGMDYSVIQRPGRSCCWQNWGTMPRVYFGFSANKSLHPTAAALRFFGVPCLTSGRRG